MKIKLFVIISLFSLLAVLSSCVSSEQEAVSESETKKEASKELSKEDEEYFRSTNELSSGTISKEEFNEDKAAILKKIEQLSTIMEDYDYEKWRKYISPESLAYYSNAANLRRVQKQLPDKTIQIKGLKDYFKYVFVPARKRSNVEEIRYISKTLVKVVDKKEVTYYTFEKKDNEWYVVLPEV